MVARSLLPIFAVPLLKRRLKNGKEHTTRWTEKLGHPSVKRPEGQLIWFHAVGLGEVLSLRGLVATMGKIDPSLNFLITSSALSSATGIAKQMPPRTQHQFLPLDAPKYSGPFLDHWRPDLVIWVEQDIWPGLICDVEKRCIPQALINARMNAASYKKHARARTVFTAVLAKMATITTQDDQTAKHLAQLGVTKSTALNISLKAATPSLAHDETLLSTLKSVTQNRRVWAVSPAHHSDIEVAMQAHKLILLRDPTILLVIVPRNLDLDLPPDLPRRSHAQLPDGPIWIADTFGELGTIYELADTVLIGGTFDKTEGHSPWEAAALNCTILHGPRTANFASDYTLLHFHKGAVLVQSAPEIVTALCDIDQTDLKRNAQTIVGKARTALVPFARSLLALRGKA